MSLPTAAAADIDTKRYDRQIRLWCAHVPRLGARLARSRRHPPLLCRSSRLLTSILLPAPEIVVRRGLDAQRGIMGARVLILGTNGLANEIAKNLVLAGIGHVRIQDGAAVDKEFLSAGGVFSVSESQLGTNRAEAMCTVLKEMNPSVDLVASPCDASKLDAALLSTYHYVVGTRGAQAVQEVAACTAAVEEAAAAAEPAAKRQRANSDSSGGPAVERFGAIARSNGAHTVCPMRPSRLADGAATPKFLAAGTLGRDGFCFFDLGTCTTTIPPVEKTDGDAIATPKSAKKESEAAASLAHKEMARYPTVHSASRVEWAALTPRVPRLYYALQLLLAQAEQPPVLLREPEADAADADVAALLPSDAPASASSTLRALLAHRGRLLKTAASNGEPKKLLTSEYLAGVATAASAELAPVAAIVGGMVANEVIKVISGKERPINNCLFFDGDKCDGLVQRLGPSFEVGEFTSYVDKGEFKRLPDDAAA